MKNFDALTALEKWTEENMVPDCLVGKAGKKIFKNESKTGRQKKNRYCQEYSDENKRFYGKGGIRVHKDA